MSRPLHADSAHTSGDAVIWFRDANVIHTGDIVELGAPPFLDWWGGGTLDGMIRGVDLVLAHADDKTRIVPGHGWVTNRSEVATYRKMLVTMRERTLAAIGAGQSVEQYLATQPTRNSIRLSADLVTASVSPACSMSA
jgi:Zn-dependent hydrolases, including glyoxylases